MKPEKTLNTIVLKRIAKELGVSWEEEIVPLIIIRLMMSVSELFDTDVTLDYVEEWYDDIPSDMYHNCRVLADSLIVDYSNIGKAIVEIKENAKSKKKKEKPIIVKQHKTKKRNIILE